MVFKTHWQKWQQGLSRWDGLLHLTWGRTAIVVSLGTSLYQSELFVVHLRCLSKKKSKSKEKNPNAMSGCILIAEMCTQLSLCSEVKLQFYCFCDTLNCAKPTQPWEIVILFWLIHQWGCWLNSSSTMFIAIYWWWCLNQEEAWLSDLMDRGLKKHLVPCKLRTFAEKWVG